MMTSDARKRVWKKIRLRLRENTTMQIAMMRQRQAGCCLIRVIRFSRSDREA